VLQLSPALSAASQLESMMVTGHPGQKLAEDPVIFHPNQFLYSLALPKHPLHCQHHHHASFSLTADKEGMLHCIAKVLCGPGTSLDNSTASIHILTNSSERR
jgi:hypothetical protein